MTSIKRILGQRPLPLLWVVVIAYALISPMALLIPPDVFTQYQWTRGFTGAVAAWVPMIDRVVAYGHPNPDQLRCFLAYAWCCVPVLMWVLHRYHEKHNKPLAWGTGEIEFWVRWALAFSYITGALFLLWYWPNFPGLGREMLAPITRPHDERRQLLWSTTSLFIYAPIWLMCFSAMLDSLRCEFLNLLWRIGIVNAYPSLSSNPDSTPTQE